ncbi:MAG: hypothetical protein Salg2KO_04810 [Salibacteraceae bacterium]
MSAAQTTLPTSFDFATIPATMPTGWTTNTTANYSSGLPDNQGGTSRAGKLQSTGHFVMIEFYDKPSDVIYNLKSYGTNSWTGTLLVQESTNGTNWSTMESLGNGAFNGNWTFFSSVPDTNSRFVRFFLSNKVSGTNAGIDDVTVVPYIGDGAEINVVYNGENVPHNTDIQFAEELNTPLPIKLGVQNLGLVGTLSLDAINITGTASADYTVASAPTSVAATLVDTIEITFTPSQAGSRIAQVSIDNNDDNEDPYIIDLDGVGGLSATEPGQNPSTANTTYLRTWRVNGSFENVGSDGYLVLMRKGQAVTDDPVDGSTYSLGDGIGDSKIVGIGSNTSYRIRSAQAETTYHLRIFAYNGSGSLINYRTSDPLDTTVTTPIASMDDPQYWQGLDETAATFVDDLYDVINPHMVRFYSNYDEDMIPGFLGRDTANGQEAITGVYSSDNVVYTPPFAWTTTSMNREHTFPSSWMPSSGSSNTPEYQDLHHLFPTVATANSQRSNRPFGIVANVTGSYGDSKAGTTSGGQSVYEPRDVQKGDAARAVLYMMTAYGWKKNQLNSNGTNQNFNTLIDWHFDDMPSEFERSRNDYIDSLQGNRNPFVDSAHWVCYIDFVNMAHIAEPDSSCLARAGINVTPVDTTDTTGNDTTTYVHELLNRDYVVYPNPASAQLVVSGIEGVASYEMVDLLGRQARNGVLRENEPIDLSGIKSGPYILILREGETLVRRQVLIQ